MASIFSILLTLVLVTAFLVVTRIEAGRGTRFFAAHRARLDHVVEHALYVFTHVDWQAFVREHARAIALYLGHEAVHLSLQAVRAAERLLTRLVRHLRSRVETELPSVGEPTRPFLQALSGLKEELKAARPPLAEAP